MNIYFNAEYTGLNEHATLISLGLISDNCERLYIEVSNVPEYLIPIEIRTTVLPDTYLHDVSLGEVNERIEKGKDDADSYSYTYVVASRDSVGTLLDEWFKRQLSDANDRIQIVSYCSHYDFCLLLNLFNGCIPSYLNTVCYDIYQDMIHSMTSKNELAIRVETTLANASSFLSTHESDTFLKNISIPEYPKDHALKFAELIKEIHLYMNDHLV